jgi:hypothetical protein
MTPEQYWESYLSRVDSITLRQQLRIHTKDIVHMLSKFDPNYPAVLDVGPGWIHIIAKLHNAIFLMNPNYRIAQVKQKLGGLRYYIYLDPQESEDSKNAKKIINNFIYLAEHQASETCEQCGEPGKLTKTNMYYRTACDYCV